MYIAYGVVRLVHKNIQVTTITIGYIQLHSKWKKSWLKCIILTKAYWLKSVVIVTECISDRNDDNGPNNYLNLICTLDDK